MEVMVAYMALAAQRETAAEDKDETKSTWRKFKRGVIGAEALAGGALSRITGDKWFGLASLALVLGQMMPLIGTSGLAAAFAAASTTAGSVAVAVLLGGDKRTFLLRLLSIRIWTSLTVLREPSSSLREWTESMKA